MPCTRHSATIVPVGLLLALCAGNASAGFISSISRISAANPLEDAGTTSSAVQSGGNSASSFVDPLTGKMGASVGSDGTAFSVSSSTETGDEWTCTGGCSALTAPLDLAATISFDAVVSKDLALGNGEFNLVAKYLLGADMFQFAASADSRAMSFEALVNGNEIDVQSSTDADGNVHLSTSVVATFVCPCLSPGGVLFDDSEGIDLEMEGTGFVDALHTFSVALTPLEPGILLTSTNGRTASSASEPPPTSVPEPPSVLLLATGLAGLAFRRRGSRPA